MAFLLMEMVLGSVRKCTWVKIIVCLVGVVCFRLWSNGSDKVIWIFLFARVVGREYKIFFILLKQKPKLQKNVEFKALQTLTYKI